MHVRTRELEHISEVIEGLPNYGRNEEERANVEDAIKNSNIIMLGDFNFHFP